LEKTFVNQLLEIRFKGLTLIPNGRFHLGLLILSLALLSLVGGFWIAHPKGHDLLCTHALGGSGYEEGDTDKRKKKQDYINGEKGENARADLVTQSAVLVQK